MVDEQARLVREVADEHGATSFQWATSPEERATLWEARHNVLYATLASRPGCKAWTTDVCVPISHLAECIVETQARPGARRTSCAPLVGHAGDGNFHLIFMLDPDDPDGAGAGVGGQPPARGARARASAAPAPASTASASAS